MVIACGFIAIVGAQLVYTLLLSAPNGVRIRSPEGSVVLAGSFVVSGDAWMREGISAVRVEASHNGAPPVSFPALRDAVRYKGKTLYELSSWNAKVALSTDGQWELRAVVAGKDGGEASSASRTVSVRAGAPVREFQSWGAEHLVPIAILLAAAVGLALFARRGRTVETEVARQRFFTIALWLTVIVWVNELAYQVYWFAIGGWSVASALMLQMCGMSILFLPVAMLSEKQKARQFLFDILYFWGIGGATQALLSPDIGANGFPAYKYFSFFLSHGLIVTMAIVMALAGGVRVTIRSFLRALVVTNIILLPIYGVDRILALIPPYDPGNYFVLGYPPPTGSPVDFFSELFGPSPRYVVGLELMGLVIFGILYLPWPVARLITSRGGPRGAALQKASRAAR
jgi:hypothetical integral membrane protein (TIGR02206 family)